jgi:diphosphomevalonate decarboxylase
MTATAVARPNIAFIKYWGNTDDALRLPVSGSISMNLDGLMTRTTVEFRDDLIADSATVDGRTMSGPGLRRISRHLDHLRRLAEASAHAIVTSANNFPSGAGIASSASAFAALTLATAGALGLKLTERELSTVARLGSGSASRSIPGGFVEWYAAVSHEASYAESIAPASHWPLVDLVAIVSQAHKSTGSTEGHTLAGTSPLQAARIHSARERLDRCRGAILKRDFEAFAEVVELDSNAMHAVMMTSQPPLLYWAAETVAIMHLVRQLRASGLGVCYTIDAGPNVHCICLPEHAEQVQGHLAALNGVMEIRKATPGGPAYLESGT